MGTLQSIPITAVEKQWRTNEKLNEKREKKEFKIGDKVLIQFPKNQKFDLGKRVPFFILQQINPVLYRVKDELEKSKIHPVVHASRLSKFVHVQKPSQIDPIKPQEVSIQKT